MKPILFFVIASFFAVSANAAEDAQADVTLSSWEKISASESDDLSEFLWAFRPIVVFADSPEDPRLAQQLALLQGGADALLERDVVILLDTDPSAKGALRKKLRPRGFMLALIGKDGGVKLRKPFPWNVRELSRVIDKMPMRQREIRERRQP